MFNNIQVNRFCDLEMRTNGKVYITVKGSKGKQLDAAKMANQFIFQHALEQTNIYEQVLDAVYQWWERYINHEKWLE